MKQYFHPIISVTLLIISTNIAVVESIMTVKQIETASRIIRESCQPLFNVNDEMIDGMKMGQFPENDDLKCFVNCMMEMTLIMRNGAPNIPFVLKQMKSALPDELREPYLNAFSACKNAADGVEGKCEIAYTLIKCTQKNNPVFVWP